MMYYVAHSGIKGQRWGLRRYQNPDGSLTPVEKEVDSVLDKVQIMTLPEMLKEVFGG